MTTKKIGDAAELQALQFLLKNGLRLLRKNYRCYFGEIDLIMQEQDTIVFVEVRKRSRVDFGTAFDSVNAKKRHKLIKTATLFLQMNNWLYKVNSRFDIIAIQPKAGNMQLEWIKNAFYVKDN